MNKELILIAAVVISVLLIYKSMILLKVLEEETPMTRAKKALLTYTAFIVPILGFLIIYLMQPSKKLLKN